MRRYLGRFRSPTESEVREPSRHELSRLLMPRGANSGIGRQPKRKDRSSKIKGGAGWMAGEEAKKRRRDGTADDPEAAPAPKRRKKSGPSGKRRASQPPEPSLDPRNVRRRSARAQRAADEQAGAEAGARAAQPLAPPARRAASYAMRGEYPGHASYPDGREPLLDFRMFVTVCQWESLGGGWVWKSRPVARSRAGRWVW